MEINAMEWKDYRIGDLFDVVLPKGDIKLDDMINGPIALISSGDKNNGLVGRINEAGDGKSKIFNGNVLTYDMFGKSYYQQEPFYAVSHGRVNILIPKFNLNKEIGLFIATVLYKEKYRFSYGRAVYSSVASNIIIKLPSITHPDGSYEPDWQYMEDFMRSLDHPDIKTKNKAEDVPELNVKEWGEFVVGELFEKQDVKHYPKIPETIGIVPFISSTVNNNGVVKYVSDVEITEGNFISVSTNGDCLDCFYQAYDCAISSDVEILRNDNLNKYNALFICSIIRQNKYRFSYGIKPKKGKLFDLKIVLPITSDGSPDWQYMENYIKSMPYGDCI